jgi:hypothetical protein
LQSYGREKLQCCNNEHARRFLSSIAESHV